MCPQPTTPSGSQGDKPASERAKREMPQFVHDFVATLKDRRAAMDGPYPGASAAERHRAETGHRLEAGCCARAAAEREADRQHD